MFDIARRALAAGRSVVLDAVFLKPEERAAAAALAGDALASRSRASGWRAEPSELRERLAARTGDASDAEPGGAGRAARA